MTDGPIPREEIARAKRDLDAARFLLSGGFDAQAVSRAYYAAFAAASGALGTLGETRSKHSGVIAAFGRMIVHERGFDADVAAALPELFDDRNAADYSFAPIDAPAAERAVDRAEAFVDGVALWLDEHPG